MSKTKKATKRFAKMGKLGKDLLKLSKNNGLDIDRVVIEPDGFVEVYLLNDGSDMNRVGGFHD